MSESTGSDFKPNLLSNEDIVNHLTKDFDKIVVDHPDAKPDQETPQNTPDDASISDDSAESLQDNDKKVDGDVPFDPDKADDKEEDSDDDDIDEIALKDAELSLTDEQKIERRKSAEVLKAEGNDRFKVGEFETSAERYTEGLRLCPLEFTGDRAMLFSNRAAAKMKLGKNKAAIKDCTKAIENDGNYIKAYCRRAQCHELTDQLDESLADFQKVLELDPRHEESQRAVKRLPPLIEQRNEKLKTEMLGKLKDLGNLILKPFGLSTENFQMTQDPDTKGYSINFNQGKKE